MVIKDLPKRKQNRLKNFDYSTNGAYFITLCTINHKCILSKIVGDGFPVPQLTICGSIIENIINEIDIQYDNVNVDTYVIMPNHIHMILTISNDFGTGNPSPTISNIIAWLKYSSTKLINQKYNSAGNRIFQRSFYDHIIRNENDYNEIWQYIEQNPKKWKEDKLYVVK